MNDLKNSLFSRAEAGLLLVCVVLVSVLLYSTAFLRFERDQARLDAQRNLALALQYKGDLEMCQGTVLKMMHRVK